MDAGGDDGAGEVEPCVWGLCDGTGVYYEEITYMDPDSHMPHTQDIIEKECPCKTEQP